MKTSKFSVIFKKAPFPAIMTIISFILFIGLYWLATARSIEPYYFVGLLFGVPFLCYGMITFFTVTEKMKIIISSIITGLLIFVFGVLMLFLFVFMAFDSATQITDVDKYERVLRLTGYPDNTLINYFPDKIPDNAESITFRYNPAFLQGGENFSLKFKVDPGSIVNSIDEFSQKAKWIGKASESEFERDGIWLSSFSTFGYTNLPEDFTIYLINSEPYKPNNWNHGYFSLAAISKERNEIIFLAEDW